MHDGRSVREDLLFRQSKEETQAPQVKINRPIYFAFCRELGKKWTVQAARNLSLERGFVQLIVDTVNSQFVVKFGVALLFLDVPGFIRASLHGATTHCLDDKKTNLLVEIFTQLDSYELQVEIRNAM